MTIKYLSSFKKQYQKLPVKFQQQFDKRLLLFIEEPTHPSLRLHPLKGSHAGYWSMNVNGDIRALYYKANETVIIFALIGTHSELYG